MDKYIWTIKQEPTFWQNIKCSLGGLCPKDHQYGCFITYLQDQLKSAGSTIFLTLLVLTLPLAGYLYRQKLAEICRRKPREPTQEPADIVAKDDDNIAEPSTSGGDQLGDQVQPRQKCPMTMSGCCAETNNTCGVGYTLDYEGDLVNDDSDEN